MLADRVETIKPDIDAEYTYLCSLLENSEQITKATLAIFFYRGARAAIKQLNKDTEVNY